MRGPTSPSSIAPRLKLSFPIMEAGLKFARLIIIKKKLWLHNAHIITAGPKALYIHTTLRHQPLVE
jgi:hypothetical protein